jgi:hypothetical protein
MDRIRYPGENPSDAKRRVTKARVWIDSRNRDVTSHPCANSFRMNLTTPLRAVTSITLTDFRVPIVSGYYYVALVLRNAKDNTLVQIKEDGSWPMGTLGMIPLVPADNAGTYTYYRYTNSDHNPGGWTLEFPQALGQLADLQFEILAWGGSTGWGGPTTTSIPYPIPSEAGQGTSDMTKNVLIGLEVTHNCQ